MTVTILFVGANPDVTGRLRLDEEVRQIQDKMRGAQYQRSIEMKAAWAARPDDLLMSLNEYKPDILHFSGHGNPNGELIFTDDQNKPKLVSEKALAATLRSAGTSIQLLVLNACYSWRQAAGITDVVPCAIGMNTAIGDRAAIVFSASLYRAIAYGASIREAFDQAIAALLLDGIPEENTPELLYRPRVDPERLILSGTERSQEERGLELVDVGLISESRYEMKNVNGIIRITLQGNDN